MLNAIGAYQNLNTWSVFWMNQVQMRECHRKAASERKVAGAISALVNANSLQLGCARFLYETLFMTILMYGS